MEEPSVVDCPPTPEILPEANTPPARHEVTYSSSSEEVDETTEGRRSPPPKCAICLGKCRQPSYTDSCSHKFCFQCLLEWSKVKPECPLCKQVFCKIAYHKPFDNCQPQITPVTARTADHNQMRNPDMYHLNFFLAERSRFTYHTSLRVRPSQSELLQQLFMHQSSDVQRFVREFGNQPIPSRQNASEWRRFIYVQRLFARPLPDLNGRYRETSAIFYLRNSAQMNRILPWVNRELSVISPSIHPRPGLSILALMQEYDCDSSSFLQGLNNIIPAQYRAHFQHELVNFARSPYDMIGYDRCIQYDPPFSGHLSPRQSPRVVISSSEPDDDDIVYLPPSPASSAMNSAAATSSNSNINTTNSNSNSSSHSTGSQAGVSGRQAGRTQFRIEARSSGETVIMTGTLREPGTVEDAVPLATTGTQTQVIEVNDDATVPSAAPSGSTPTTSMVRAGPSTLRDGDNISLSSSDSDECQFVREQKPPHLRTPDHVVDLECESDSDVVFVDEGPVPAPQIALESGAATQMNQQDSMKNEASTGGYFEYNQGASTSSGYCGGISSGSVASVSALSGQRSKYYATPILNRYTGGRGMKSIYEASDTDDSDAEEISAPAYMPSSSSSSSSSHEEMVFRSVKQPSGAAAGRGRKRKSLLKRTAQLRGGKKTFGIRGMDVSSDSSVGSNVVSNKSSSSSSSTTNSSSTSSSSSSASSNSSRSSSSSSGTSSRSGNRRNSSSSSTSSSDNSDNVNVRRRTAKRRKRVPSSSTRQKSNKSKVATARRSGRTRGDGQTGKSTKLSNQVAATAIASGTSRSKVNRRHKKQRTDSPEAPAASKNSTKTTSKPSKRRKTEAKSCETRNTRASKRSKRELKEESVSHTATGVTEPAVGDWEARSLRDHYFIEMRPSSTISEDAATGGGACKLKSVIIKRCHYTKKPTTTATTSPKTLQVEPTSPDLPNPISLPPNVPNPIHEVPSTSGLVAVGQPEDSTGVDRREETAAALVQLSSVGSGSGSETDVLDENVWSVLKFSMDIDPSEPGQEQVQQELQVQEVPLPEPPQTQSTDDDQQQFQLDSVGILMEEESNLIASESLFAPSVNWSGSVESHEPGLGIAEDRLSSTAVSPYSSVSFAPSTASVSTSPILSLVVPTDSAPVELLEVVEPLDGESPLPSSVVDIGTIEETMGEIMESEEFPAIRTATATTVTSNEMSLDASSSTLPGCVLNPTPGGSAGDEPVGDEVEL